MTRVRRRQWKPRTIGVLEDRPSRSRIRNATPGGDAQRGPRGEAEVSLVTGLEAALPQASPSTHRVQSSDGSLGPAAADSAAGRR